MGNCPYVFRLILKGPGWARRSIAFSLLFDLSLSGCDSRACLGLARFSRAMSRVCQSVYVWVCRVRVESKTQRHNVTLSPRPWKSTLMQLCPAEGKWAFWLAFKNHFGDFAGDGIPPREARWKMHREFFWKLRWKTALETASASPSAGARKRIENRNGFCSGFCFLGVAAKPLGGFGWAIGRWF